MVLAYAVGIIQIETLGAKPKLIQVLGRGICILQGMDLVKPILKIRVGHGAFFPLCSIVDNLVEM